MGRLHELSGTTVAENQNDVKGIGVHWRGLYLKITELLQQRWQQTSVFILKTVSTKTVWRELHKSNYRGRAAVVQLPITDSKAKRRKRWCDDHKTWISWLEIHMVRCPLPSFTKSDRVYVWRTPKEACIPECLVPTVKHGGKSGVIWAAISCYFAGPVITWHVW